jgi:hypothetical protein
MYKFIIERNLPGAENLSGIELDCLGQEFVKAADKLGKVYTWIHSYIAQDKIYCLVMAESEEIIREHARTAMIPVNIISKVETILMPSIKKQKKKKDK